MRIKKLLYNTMYIIIILNYISIAFFTTCNYNLKKKLRKKKLFKMQLFWGKTWGNRATGTKIKEGMYIVQPILSPNKK